MSRSVIAAVDDMFFASKIRAVAEQLGIEVQFIRTASAVIERARESRPSLIVVDLHSQKLQPIELATLLKGDDELRSITLLGFFSHVQAELQRTALQAGYDKAIPRSVFSKDLAQILAVAIPTP
jgi:CheY-like chemotaxis protein